MGNSSHVWKDDVDRRKLVREKIREVVGKSAAFNNTQAYGVGDKYWRWNSDVAKKIETVIKENSFERFVDVVRTRRGAMIVHIRDVGYEFDVVKK